MKKHWLKFKKYPHIGAPLICEKDRGWVSKYVQNPKYIAKHKFTPLLHRTISQRKYRPAKGAPKDPASRKRKRTVGKKTRHIYYPSHLDSIVYSYYNHILTKHYEQYIEGKPFEFAPVAYRQIPVKEGSYRNKSNIEFAFEAFKYIEANKHRQLSVLIADVTSFFDNLDHRILHSQWKRVLGLNNLPDDHYNVYKNLINFSYVNENEIFKRFRHKLIVERSKPYKKEEKELKTKFVKKIWNQRNEKVVGYCENSEFFNEATDLIRKNKPYNSSVRASMGKEPKKGIPQGTPISATLANIYMLDFDECIYQKGSLCERSVFYQRYSDDIIIVCETCDEEFFYDLLRSQICDLAKLEIHPQKTKIYRLQKDSFGIFGGGIFSDGTINRNKQIEYLGFVYDGQKVRVKSASFSRFYRKMNRSFRRGTHFAKMDGSKSHGLLFERRLYQNFTHRGAKRRLKWLPDKHNPSGYSRSTQCYWGNFITYLNKANSIMKEINGDDCIKRQYRHIWDNFHKIKRKSYEEIG